MVVEVVIGLVHITVPNELRFPHGIHDAMTGAPSEVPHDVLDPIDVVQAEHGSVWGE